MEINGSQCTIAWYVDDTKISHKDPEVVTSIIKKIESKHDKMTVTRGRKHTFVGMDFELKDDGSIHITTVDYIKEALADFGEIVHGTSQSPANKNLFIIDKESTELTESKANIFHSIVAKLLYVSRRSRLDIGLAVAFLSTRVSKSTIQDWNKLRRLLRYLKSTIDMPRIIRSE